MTPCLTIAGPSGSVRHVIRTFGHLPAGPGGHDVYDMWCGQRRSKDGVVEFLPVFTHPDVLRVAMDVLQQAGVVVDPAVLQLLLPAEPVEYEGADAPADERLRQRRVRQDEKMFGTALAEAKELRRRITKDALTAAQAVRAVVAVALEVRGRPLEGPNYWAAPAFVDLFWARRWGNFLDALLPDAEDEFKGAMVRIMVEEDEKGVLLGEPSSTTSSMPPRLCDACRLAFSAAALKGWA